MHACRKVHDLEEQLVEVRAQLLREIKSAEDTHHCRIVAPGRAWENVQSLSGSPYMHSMDDLNVHVYACRKVHVLEEQLVEVRAQLLREIKSAEDAHHCRIIATGRAWELP